MIFMRDEMQMVMQTTGGDTSTLNGIAEAPHKIIKKMTRSLLYSHAHSQGRCHHEILASWELGLLVGLRLCELRKKCWTLWL